MKSRANPPAGIEWVSCLFLSLFQFLNILGIWVFIGLIFKLIGGFKNDYFKFYINESVAFIKFIAVLLCPLDLFLFYRKRNQIKSTCELFSPKRRVVGKIKFWMYLVLSIIIFWLYYELRRITS